MSGKSRSPEVLAGMAHRHFQTWLTGTVAVEYPIGKTVLRIDDLLVFVSGALKRPADSGGARDYRIRGLHEHTPATSAAYPGDSNTVRFTVAPNGLPVCFVTAGG